MRRMTKNAVALLLCGACLPPASAVNKCVGDDGRVTYTDSPCASGSQVSRVDVLPPPPTDARLAAQRRGEQAVEEARRLEARRDAEAAERQRRYELERQAEEVARQRAALDEEAERLRSLYPVPVVVRPYRPPVPVLKPKEPAQVTERPSPMRSYPFR